MSVGDSPPAQVPIPSFRYRLLRGLLRIWVNLFFRRIRFLNPAALPDVGAAMLIVAHSGSLLDALLLIAALKRKVHCVMDPRLLRGPWRGLLGWSLSVIPHEPVGDGLRRATEAACKVLLKGEALLIFVEEKAAKPGEPPHFSPTPAVIALQAELGGSGKPGLKMFPVHLFLPVGPLYSSELLIHIDAPLIPRQFLLKREILAEQARVLTAALEEACRQNVFRLNAGDVQQFLSDLEEVLRAELQEVWAAQPNWKQKMDGFELSRFVVEWVDQLNCLHPGQLVALRDSLDSYREALRRCSLRQLEVEQAGAWIKTSWRRIAAWTESALGLPLAVYGLVNHLVPCFILQRAGLFQKKERNAGAMKWAGRALVVIGCYALQILLCAYWLGRATAGYYALTLPLSGAYLWRYAGWVRHRMRLVLLDFRVRREAAKLVRMRKDLIREVNAARNVYLETLGLAH